MKGTAAAAAAAAGLIDCWWIDACTSKKCMGDWMSGFLYVGGWLLVREWKDKFMKKWID